MKYVKNFLKRLPKYLNIFLYIFFAVLDRHPTKICTTFFQKFSNLCKIIPEFIIFQKIPSYFSVTLLKYYSL